MSAFPARTAELDFWSVSTLHAFVTFWTGDPFLALPTAVPLAFLAAFIVALALAGLGRAYRHAQIGIARPQLAILGVAAVGAGLLAVSSPVLAAFNAPGRLAYVGLAAVVALVAAGLWIELRSPRLRWGVVGLFGVLSLAGQAILLYPSPPAPSNPGQPEIVTLKTVDAHGSLDGVTVLVPVCADDSARDTWLSVTIVNNGQTAAEWSQHLEVDAFGHQVATSDYSRSSQLPLRLEPGRTYSGWFWLGPTDRLRQYSKAQLVLRNVAVDGYRTVGDIVIDTTLC